MIMKARGNEIQQMLLSIGVWENEGGAAGRDCLDQQYGRRIEADRSRTVYHVFTGAPGHVDGRTMTGLSQSYATDCMLFLNRRNDERRKDRPTARARSTQSTIEDCLS